MDEVDGMEWIDRKQTQVGESGVEKPPKAQNAHSPRPLGKSGAAAGFLSRSVPYSVLRTVSSCTPATPWDPRPQARRHRPSPLRLRMRPTLVRSSSRLVLLMAL